MQKDLGFVFFLIWQLEQLKYHYKIKKKIIKF